MCEGEWGIEKENAGIEKENDKKPDKKGGEEEEICFINLCLLLFVILPTLRNGNRKSRTRTHTVSVCLFTPWRDHTLMNTCVCAETHNTTSMQPGFIEYIAQYLHTQRLS